MSAVNPPAADLSAVGSARQERLHGTLGVAGIVFMVVAASSPLTVVGGGVPVALAIGNGPGVPAAYLLVAVILLLFSVGYSLMSRHVTNTGAFYSYITRGISKPAGLGAAFVALVSYTTIQLAVYGLFGATLSGLLASWGVPNIPWWLCAVAALAVVAVLGYRNIDLSVKVLGVLMLCEVAIITIVCVAVLARGGADGVSLTSFTPSAFFSGSPGIGVMFAIASFMGFEATAIYSEEARDAKRTVPIATYVAVILIGVFYAFASWAMVIAYGSGKVVAAAQENTAGLTFATAQTYVGTWAEVTMNILMVTSLFAVLLAFHNAIARYLFSLGREHVVSERFGRSHTKYGSPHFGSLTQTVSALIIIAIFALAGLDPVAAVFAWMSGLATLGLIALMALTSAGVIVFFRRSRLDTRPWNTVIAPALGLAGLLFLLVLVVWNFTTLIGGSMGLAITFEAIIVVAFVLGYVLAARWKTSRPDTYAQLGSFTG
ncbi:APC family permease [Microbacterium kribbense]|uniref:APC family permease n=1 Tax=Microbacterium kribbense TaxID=433645 RepID=A0ABP7G7X1_9MICO